MSKEYKIYTLAHPITKEVRYVGFTSNSLYTRHLGHVGEVALKKSNTYKRNWITSLKKQGLKPEIELLEVVTEDTWAQAEQYWIAQFRAWGFRLTNLTDGGEGNLGYKPSAATKLLTSKAVSQFTYEGEFIATFVSAVEASKSTGVHKTGLGEAARDLTTAGGFRWRMGTDTTPMESWTGMRPRKVLQYSLDGTLVKTWDSSREAGLVLGFSGTNIFKVLSGERTSAGKFIWRYEGDPEPPKAKPNDRGLYKQTAVKDLLTQEVHLFSSAVEAANFLGVSNKVLWVYMNTLKHPSKTIVNKEIYYV